MANNKMRILYLMRLLLERTDERHGLTAEGLCFFDDRAIALAALER